MAETLSSLADLAGSTVASEAVAAPVHVQKLDKEGRAYATGKRKNAVARVWIKPGKGQSSVNGKPLDVYFARPVLRMILNQPLVVANRLTQYDITVTVAGGGLSGQAVGHGQSFLNEQLVCANERVGEDIDLLTRVVEPERRAASRVDAETV